jgi:hypothetical protein
MAFFYKSGEEIKSGDRVLFHAETGTIDFMVEPDDSDPAKKWYVTEFGGGVMILEPKHFGRVFLDAAELVEHESNWEDLEFISRAESNY